MAYLGWARPGRHHVVVALWQALDGGGGWVASSMVVVVGRKKQQRGNSRATVAAFGKPRAEVSYMVL